MLGFRGAVSKANKPSDNISWVILGELNKGQLIQQNPTDYVGSTDWAAIPCVPGKASVLKKL